MNDSILRKILNNIDYENNINWNIENIETFSHNKRLYYYQVDAIKNLLKSLYFYFEECESDRNVVKEKYEEFSNIDFLDVKKYNTNRDERLLKENEQFKLYSPYYNVEDNKISGKNFLNRNSFWMATASGKSILIIKLIEILQKLMQNGAIPKREILLLLPSQNLVEQMEKEFFDYNLYKSDNKIELINLKNYSKSKKYQSIFNNYKVYYYRSDLIRDKNSELYIDYKEIEKNGEWYIILDEAHKGSKEDSLMQNYISIMSRNGFLFNFSATFTEKIDFITNCFNFNLEKFINAGYGKNIYLLEDTFKFNESDDEISEKEKQKELLKSLIVFYLLKKEKSKTELYHNPLMITLVNSVNIENSDLLNFFKKIEEIATDDIDIEMLNSIKNELFIEFTKEKEYIFGNEKVVFNCSELQNLTINDLRKTLFHSETKGAIEIIQGKSGKELCLKLETADKPFALIKIGDTDTFKHDNLSDNYKMISNYRGISYFSNLNNNPNINILIGSRSFYEGWDSNRPNIINLINIGGSDAMKFIPQAVGRGIRIEPKAGYRKRLLDEDGDKNKLLETLFIFPTDKDAINCILDIIKEVKSEKIEGYKIKLQKNDNLENVELLYPKFVPSSNKSLIEKISISENDIKRFKDYIANISKEVLFIQKNLTIQQVNYIFELIEKDVIFSVNENNHFNNMNNLLDFLIEHIKTNVKDFSEIKEINDEITHYEQIELFDYTQDTIKDLMQKINEVNIFSSDVDKKELAIQFSEGKITQDELLEKMQSKPEVYFDNIIIRKLINHYYNPLLLSMSANIKNIIKEESEIDFVNSLTSYIEKNNKSKWFFSKIVENVDKISIPYFDNTINKYRNFYPDFIFWVFDKQDNCRIIFVDPKGTKIADYQNKIDAFTKFFYDSDMNPIQFKHNGKNISFELVLINKNIDGVSDLYKKFWRKNTDFTWLFGEDS